MTQLANFVSHHLMFTHTHTHTHTHTRARKQITWNNLVGDLSPKWDPEELHDNFFPMNFPKDSGGVDVGGDKLMENYSLSTVQQTRCVNGSILHASFVTSNTAVMNMHTKHVSDLVSNLCKQYCYYFCVLGSTLGNNKKNESTICS